MLLNLQMLKDILFNFMAMLTWFYHGLNEKDKICSGETTARQLPIGNGFAGGVHRLLLTDLRYKRPVLTVQYHAARLAFAREHQIHHWCPVLYTDENRFTLSTCDRCESVWRCRGECYGVCNFFQHEWFGSGSVMVCGGISLEGCTDLHVLANSTFTAVRD